MSWQDQLRGWLDRPFVGLLFVFGLSLSLAARHAIRISSGRGRLADKADKTDKLCALLGTGVLCLLAADAVDQIGRRFDSDFSVVMKAASIGVVLAGALVCLQFAFRPPDRASAEIGTLGARAISARNVLARGVLIISFGSAAWFGCRFYAAAFPTPAFVDNSTMRGGLCESKDYLAWTDRGNEIRLYRMEGDSDGPDAKGGGRQGAEDDYPEMAILRQSRNVRSNCHGWVFCDGRFVLPGDAIPQILEDNSYSVVDKPRAGDLVLYRDETGQFAHSGVVRGILDDGTVMVESKWGVDRRYLHTACDQPYSQVFSYYRSARQGHRLTITKTLPEELRLSPEDKRALRSFLHVGPNVRNPPRGAGKNAIPPSHHG